jgi:hypothetical protein
MNIDHRACTRGAVARASAMHTMHKWLAEEKCRDLIAARPAAATGAPCYIVHDIHAHLRARLRLNRSNLNSSRHRRGMINSPMCRCGAAHETPGHLLACPEYAAAAHAFSSAGGW